MLPNGIPYKGKWVDRRGRLSLLCGIPLDRKNHSNRLPLGTPPLGGGWVGLFHSERGGGEAPSFPLREAGRGGRRKASVPTMVPTAIFDVYVFL